MSVDRDDSGEPLDEVHRDKGVLRRRALQAGLVVPAALALDTALNASPASADPEPYDRRLVPADGPTNPVIVDLSEWPETTSGTVSLIFEDDAADYGVVTIELPDPEAVRSGQILQLWLIGNGTLADLEVFTDSIQLNLPADLILQLDLAAIDYGGQSWIAAITPSGASVALELMAYKESAQTVDDLPSASALDGSERVLASQDEQTVTIGVDQIQLAAKGSIVTSMAAEKTISAADAFTHVVVAYDGRATWTIAPSSEVPIPIGVEVVVEPDSPCGVLLTTSAGVSINRVDDGTVLVRCGQTARLRKIGLNRWRAELDDAADQPESGFVISDDGFAAELSTVSATPFQADIAGSGSSVTGESAEAGRFGVYSCTTGSDPTDRSGIRTSMSAIGMGPGVIEVSAIVKFDSPSDGTDSYVAPLGLFTDPSSNDQADGVYFLYDHAGSSAGSESSSSWQCVTAEGSTRTFSSTSVPVAGWQRLRIVVDATNANAWFFVDDVEVARITTNIPSAQLGAAFEIFRTNGDGGTLKIDHVMVRGLFATQR